MAATWSHWGTEDTDRWTLQLTSSAWWYGWLRGPRCKKKEVRIKVKGEEESRDPKKATGVWCSGAIWEARKGGLQPKSEV